MSSDLLYNRSGSLRVGIPGGEGRDFSGLRINFDIEKTSESNPNTSTINIYNLNANSRAFVQQEDLTAILEVGYIPFDADPFISIITVGDIRKGKVKSERQGTDWVTTFEMGDGEVSLQESFVNESFPSGTSITQVIQSVAASFGGPVNTMLGIQEKTYNSPFNISGGARDILDNLASEAGVEWSIQDGEVQVIGSNISTNDDVIFLSPETGLLSSPINRERGIELKALLNPRVRPGRRLFIDSRDVSGEFRVRKVNFSGDTLEGDWIMRIEAI